MQASQLFQDSSMESDTETTLAEVVCATPHGITRAEVCYLVLLVLPADSVSGGLLYHSEFCIHFLCSGDSHTNAHLLFILLIPKQILLWYL